MSVLGVHFHLVRHTFGEWFWITTGVRQGCLLSLTLFNIMLEQIINDALDKHDGTVNMGGQITTNLRFADDIDALAGTEIELHNLITLIDNTSRSYGNKWNTNVIKNEF